jgi:hypothetical protein
MLYDGLSRIKRDKIKDKRQKTKVKSRSIQELNNKNK